ncbi:ribonuclease inhibitor [Mesorhizobium sp. SB112]|uniref:barstar family protein n=1 Tax=Mesorhizobium sp. SB112 TaxID=3151853 RepID=UPI003267B0DE
MTFKTLIIDGNNVHDISSFYDEINRVFMAGEDWKIGPSLDALDDMLYGGFGALKGDEAVILTWKAIEKSRDDLGLDATRSYYLKKLEQPSNFDVGRIRQHLAELESGIGPTYFEIVLQIIADHANIELRSA